MLVESIRTQNSNGYIQTEVQMVDHRDLQFYDGLD